MPSPDSPESQQEIENREAVHRVAAALRQLKRNKSIKRALSVGTTISASPVEGITLSMRENPDDTLKILCTFYGNNGGSEAEIRTRDFRFPLEAIPIETSTITVGNPAIVLAGVMEQYAKMAEPEGN